MEVAYQTRWADAWRFYLYTVFADGKVAGFFLAVLAGGWLLGPFLLGVSRSAGLADAAGCVLAALVAILGLGWLEAAFRFPQFNSIRACTTRIDADGLQDTTPNGVRFTRWSDISAIRLVRGDVYFITVTLGFIVGGFYIPRSGFTSEAHAREYVAEACRLQRIAFPVDVNSPAYLQGILGRHDGLPRPTPSQKQARDQQPGCGATLAVPVFAVLITLLIWSASGWWTDRRLAAAFHQSPGCTASAPSASAFSPCTAQTLLVAHAWIVHHQKHPDEYNLTLHGPGVTQTVEVAPSLLKRLGLGMPVQATLWRGRIVRVSKGRLTSRTDKNPDVALRSDKSLLGMNLFALALYAFLFWDMKRRSANPSRRAGDRRSGSVPRRVKVKRRRPVPERTRK